MKKSLIVFLIIALLCTSIVSAGFFGDVWEFVTGKAVGKMAAKQAIVKEVDEVKKEKGLLARAKELVNIKKFEECINTENIVKLTDDSAVHVDINPRIYEDKVIWAKSYNNGYYTSYHILVYDITTDTTTEIVESEPYSEDKYLYPTIYNNQIVAVKRSCNDDERKLFIYNLNTSETSEVELIESSNICKSCEYKPEIYENKVVWTNAREGGIFYLYDLLTNEVARIDVNDCYTSSYGYSSSCNEIGNPLFFEDKIIWVGQGGYWGKIYSYDINTGVIAELSEDSWEDIAIDGNIIVGESWYSPYRNEGLAVYDLTTNTKSWIRTGEDINIENPAIYEDRIFWSEYRDGKYDIYMYDLSENEEIQITDVETSDLLFSSSGPNSPTVYEDKIVWVQNNDIYLLDYWIC